MEPAASGLGSDRPHPGPLQSWPQAPGESLSATRHSLTGPGGVQPVLYMQDLFILGPAVCLLTDPVVFGNFFLKSGGIWELRH